MTAGRTNDEDRSAGGGARAHARGEEVSFVECPRDAWQALERTLPLEERRAYLREAAASGITSIDAASFVAPRAVPQLADSERMLADLALPRSCELVAIVANARGAIRAMAVPEVQALALPISVTPSFERRNVGREPHDSWAFLGELRARAAEGGRTVVLYLSMAFGNPDDDPWSPGETAAAVERARDAGQRRVVLADTVGRAGAAEVAAVLDACAEPERLGLHMHARPDAWEPLLGEALLRGVRAFEGACRGLGGCPFAGDALVGNLPSELVVPWLHAQGMRTGIDERALALLAQRAERLGVLGGG